MTQLQEAPAPDLAAIKAKQQQTWSSGDFHVVAALIQPTAEQLVDSADLHAGMRVLDVATGSGNAAIAAARLGATVEGVDYVPALLERGRVRAAAEGYDIRFVEGDAEALPYADGEFDAVTTIFGSMFAPDHERPPRSCSASPGRAAPSPSPAGRRTGFIGQMFKTVGGHVPPPAGCLPAALGDRVAPARALRRRISSLAVTERTFTWRFTRRRRSSTPSAPGTARRSRRSRPSTKRPRRLWRPTWWPWPELRPARRPPTPSRCRRPTSRPSRSGADPAGRRPATAQEGEAGVPVTGRRPPSAVGATSR